MCTIYCLKHAVTRICGDFCESHTPLIEVCVSEIDEDIVMIDGQQSPVDISCVIVIKMHTRAHTTELSRVQFCAILILKDKVKFKLQRVVDKHRQLHHNVAKVIASKWKQLAV